MARLAYILALVMAGLLVVSGQPAWAQIDPPPPGGSCDPAEANSCPDDDNLCDIEFCNPQTLQCDERPTCPADSDNCTAEVCDPFTGGCSQVPADPLPDGCNEVGCDPNGIAPCPPGENACVPNVCNPETRQCEPQPVVCDQNDNRCTVEACNPQTGLCEPGESRTCDPSEDPCLTSVCDEETGECVVNPTNPAPEGCEGAICRTPGFWGTHALTVTKKKAVNITQAVITAAGGSLSVCGTTITSTLLNDNNSAVEAICVSPSGEIRLQLARQLTAAALNCVISGGGGDCAGTPLYATLFADCNAVCADSGASTSSITSCIGDIDCLNNGGTKLASGFCQTGTCADSTPCNSSTPCLEGACAPLDGSCHTEPLVNSDLGLSFQPPGAAGSSSLCNNANKSPCTVVGSGVGSCTK